MAHHATGGGHLPEGFCLAQIVQLVPHLSFVIVPFDDSLAAFTPICKTQLISAIRVKIP
jgi:hypothetical protein